MSLMKSIKALAGIKGGSTLKVIVAIVVLIIAMVVLAAVDKYLIKWALVIGGVYIISRTIIGLGSRNE